jgi:ribosomal 50S subunit-recycling heat shock protein
MRNSGIIPRRTRAKEACDEGLVKINGMVAKPADDVEPGDTIRVELGLQKREYEVLQMADVPVPKKKRDEYAKLVSREKIDINDW